MTWPERNTGSYVPCSLREVRWFFNVPINHFREEKGRRGLRLIVFYPKRTVFKAKAAHSPQYFTILSVGSVCSLNPRTPPRQSSALLRESANRQSIESGFHFLNHDHFPFCFPARNVSGIIFSYVIRTICNRLSQKRVFFLIFASGVCCWKV